MLCIITGMYSSVACDNVYELCPLNIFHYASANFIEVTISWASRSADTIYDIKLNCPRQTICIIFCCIVGYIMLYV